MLKKNKENFKKNLGIFLMFLVFFVLDRCLKSLAMASLEKVNVIGDFLVFSFLPNKFISFSIPFYGKTLFMLITVLLLIIVLYSVVVYKREKYREFVLWIGVLLGALSNFIDRIKFSFVVDYLEIMNLMVFNLADVMIVLGCFFIIFLNFKKIKI